MMMNISPSHHHHPTLFFNKGDHHLDDPEWFLKTEEKKTFNSAEALTSHKSSHHVVQQPQTNNQNRILKITFFLSSVRNKKDNNNDVVDHHGKQQQQQQQQKKPYLCRVCERVFSSNRGLNGHVRCHSSKKGSSASSLLEQNNHQDQLPAIDLSRFLPPTYNTNKRSKRFRIDEDLRDVAQSLLDMSRGKSLYFDVDHNQPHKRLKLSGC